MPPIGTLRCRHAFGALAMARSSAASSNCSAFRSNGNVRLFELKPESQLRLRSELEELLQNRTELFLVSRWQVGPKRDR